MHTPERKDDMPNHLKRETPENVATTRRAEEIRESTGCSWESACARAELERDLAGAYSTDHEREAYRLGVAAAEAAASWAADGNTPDEHRRRVLAMLADGDPMADDYLPAMPNLSGERADALTPHSLAGEILGDESDEQGELREDPSVVDAIADAWEAGVSDTFRPACERELRAGLGEDV
jgi:hypothetical protein